jgi:hypothetical protein
LSALLRKAAKGAEARTLANLVVFDPVRNIEAATKIIRKKKTRYDTGFVIQSYLDTNHDPSVIGPDVVTWLGYYGASVGASFILTAWFRSMERLLDQGDARNPAFAIEEEMLEKLEAWCRRRTYNLNASWALQTLVDQRGFQAVDRTIEDWVGRHRRTVNAAFVIQRCLRSTQGQDERPIEWAKEWLDSEVGRKHPKEASYLFRDLRDCVLKFETILFSEFQKQLWEFLNLDLPLHQGRDLCRYWLELGGSPEAAMPIVQKLVQKDVRDPRVRFCFEAWFNVETDHPRLFEREMELWVRENAVHPKASYVFGFWDDLGLDLAKISLELGRWLDDNIEDSQFAHVLERYMRSSPSGPHSVYGISEEQAPVWLKKTDFGVQDCRIIEFILRAPFEQDNGSGLGKAAIEAAHRFLKQHADNIASAFLIALVLKRVGNETWIRSFADEWLSLYPHRHRASLVYQALLMVEENPECLLEPILAWFKHNPSYELAGGLLMAWNDNGCDRDLLRPEAKVWLRGISDQDEISDADAVRTTYGL